MVTHEGRLDKAIEEAWIGTQTLPMGSSARAGRFASQIGYLNQRHLHAHDFVERHLLYRALMDGHCNDDGLRVNVTLPTYLYWMVGAEVFQGKKLVPETATEVNGAGTFTLTSKMDGDLNRSHS